MEKRYQVFVSSTYADLQEERQEVMQALLELECIPAGMELFPAANEDQWTLIQKVIDDCDYYLVVLAGRYGSIGPSGASYTEMEYRYALEAGKPIIGFVHKAPGELPADRCEATDHGRAKLEAFREFVKLKVCRFWDSPADLGSQVSRSLVKLIKSNPAVGWVRGDLVPDESAAEELLTLRRRIEDLESQLRAARTAMPEGTSNLAQGMDEFEIRSSFVASEDKWEHNGEGFTAKWPATWNDIFSTVSPLMINEASESTMFNALEDFCEVQALAELRKTKKFKDKHFFAFKIDRDDFQTIKIQLRALGLIAKNTRNRSLRDTATYWALTPYGDTIMTRLRAIQKASEPVCSGNVLEQ